MYDRHQAFTNVSLGPNNVPVNRFASTVMLYQYLPISNLVLLIDWARRLIYRVMQPFPLPS